MNAFEEALKAKEFENDLTIEGSKEVTNTEETKTEEKEGQEGEAEPASKQIRVIISIETHLYRNIDDLIKKNSNPELFEGATIEHESTEGGQSE